MDRRDFFKKTSLATLGLIFAPAVAKVLAEEAPEIILGTDPIDGGKGLWAYVTRNGVTKYYTPGQLCKGDLEILRNPPGWALDYQFVCKTGATGMKDFRRIVEQYQTTWFRVEATLQNENEK